jgi:hypothetical protein
MPDYAVPLQEWTPEMWQTALRDVIKYGVMPYENVDDVVTAAWILGQKRAALMGHPFWAGVDAQLPMNILCYWPFKIAYSPETRARIVARRWDFISGIQSNRADPESRRRVQEMIPDKLLTWRVGEIYRSIADNQGAEIVNLLGW